MKPTKDSVEFNYRKEHFKTAEADLVSSKTLSNKKSYPQAVFYLQQALEKCTKYLFMDSNIFGEINLNNHDSLNIYKEALQNLLKQYTGENNITNPIILKNIDAATTESDSLIEQISFIDKLKSFNLKKPTADLMLFVNENIKESLIGSNQSNSLNELTFIEFAELMNSTGHFDEEQLIILRNAYENPALKEMIIKGYDLIANSLPNFIEGVMIIFYLNILYSAHAVRARYPDEKDKHSPIDYYNDQNILVQSLDLHIDCAEHAFEKVKEYYSETNYFKNH